MKRILALRIAAAAALLWLTACSTPQEVRDEAGFAASTVSSFRSQLRTTLREADESSRARRDIALRALDRDVELRRDVTIVDMVKIQTNSDRKTALARMSSLADTAYSLRDDPADARAFRDRLAKIMPTGAASFSELDKTEASLTALSQDLSNTETIKFLFNYAKAVATSMKEQAKATNENAEAKE